MLNKVNNKTNSHRQTDKEMKIFRKQKNFGTVSRPLIYPLFFLGLPLTKIDFPKQIFELKRMFETQRLDKQSLTLSSLDNSA